MPRRWRSSTEVVSKPSGRGTLGGTATPPGHRPSPHAPTEVPGAPRQAMERPGDRAEQQQKRAPNQARPRP